jgi:hypothetical protein
MTPKSPEEQAAELYPYPKDGSPLDDHITELIREAWLSRQAEVDGLKRQVENYKESYYKAVSDAATQLAAKEKGAQGAYISGAKAMWKRLRDSNDRNVRINIEQGRTIHELKENIEKLVKKVEHCRQLHEMEATIKISTGVRPTREVYELEQWATVENTSFTAVVVTNAEHPDQPKILRDGDTLTVTRVVKLI